MDTRESLIEIADKILLQLARNEITHSDPQVKIAVLIKESLNTSEILSVQPGLRFGSFPNKNRPVMLDTCLEVYEFMIKTRTSFSYSSSKVADRRQIRDSTVRQACCGNLGLSAEIWNKFYNSKFEDYLEIKSALLRVYHEYESYIELHINKDRNTILEPF